MAGIHQVIHRYNDTTDHNHRHRAKLKLLRVAYLFVINISRPEWLFIWPAVRTQQPE
jgi:hypothetical protein